MRRTLANHGLSHTLVLSAQHSLYYVRDASRSTLKPLTAVPKLHSLRNTLLIYKNNIGFLNIDCLSIHKVFLFFEWYYFLNCLRV